MGLNIKNEEVERLVTEVSRITGETKTEAIRQALLERKRRLAPDQVKEGRAKAFQYLRDEVWPGLTTEQRKPISKQEWEETLGIDTESS